MAENEEDDVGGDGHDQPDYDEPLSPLSPDLAHEFEDGVTKEELAAHGLPPLPKGWVAFKEEEQDAFYYYNAENDETIWEHPLHVEKQSELEEQEERQAPPPPPQASEFEDEGEGEGAEGAASAEDVQLEEEFEDALTTEELGGVPLPPGWVAFKVEDDAEHVEGRGNIYFYHAATGETLWEHPAELHPDKLEEISEKEKEVGPYVPVDAEGGGEEDQGEFEAAKQQYEQDIEDLEDQYGQDDERALRTRLNLSNLLKGHGDLVAARGQLEWVVTGRNINLGPGHKDTLDATGKLADVMAAQGQAEDGQALYEAARARYEATNGPAEDDAAKAYSSMEGAPPPPVALGMGVGQEESKGEGGEEGEGDGGGGDGEDGESDMEESVASLDPEDFYGSDSDTDGEDEDDEGGVIAGCMCVPSRKKEKREKLIRRNYVSHDGSIRFEMVKELHNPETELTEVAHLDERSHTLKAGETVYLVDLKWITQWIFFASRGDRTPPPINNTRLVGRKTGKVKKKARYNKEFRPIDGKTWRYLHKLYKGGPTIKFKVPEGVDLNDPEEIYTFINAVSMTQMAEVVQKTHMPTEFESEADRDSRAEWGDVNARTNSP